MLTLLLQKQRQRYILCSPRKYRFLLGVFYEYSERRAGKGSGKNAS